MPLPANAFLDSARCALPASNPTQTPLLGPTSSPHLRAAIEDPDPPAQSPAILLVFAAGRIVEYLSHTYYISSVCTDYCDISHLLKDSI
jgi:hypothetical protein